MELYKTDKCGKNFPEYYLIRLIILMMLAKDSLDEWIYFLKNEEIKDSFKAKGLAKAKEVLDYLKCSEPERLEYEAYKESLHYQASMHETNYIAARLEGKPFWVIRLFFVFVITTSYLEFFNSKKKEKIR
jgi:hypothetical protein